MCQRPETFRLRVACPAELYNMRVFTRFSQNSLNPARH
uniref:Uncharacterized protein n=1 Tax=Anguilla anguilla TaxID=7936 RepID=A0A0E9TV98_ANGAN